MDFISHFGFKAAPFSTTPDPEYAYATREHRLALNKLGYYTQERQGIFLLTGAIGTGKTTISQLALNTWRADPDRYLAAHVTDPSPRTTPAFLRLILAAFGLETTRNLLDLKAIMRGFLVEQARADRTVILMLDEAQTIQRDNLDAIQALANEQTQKVKLLQIVLLAQPNFEQKLIQKPALRSRIAGGTTLNPLTLEDSIELLRHRMGVAGGDFDAVFPATLHKVIYNATKGVPRDLCILCTAALVNAAAMGSAAVDEYALGNALVDLRFKGYTK